jgi:hypothetical protein
MAESDVQNVGDMRQDWPTFAPRPAIERVPRSLDEEALLLAERPPYWEYLFLAGVLRRKMQELEPQWRDHELGYVEPHGQSLTLGEAVETLSRAFGVAFARTSNVNRIFAPESIERAIGAPGQPGNSEQIEHLAGRLIAVYAGLLQWAADMRGALVPPSCQAAFETASRVVDRPLRQIREFVNLTVAEIERIPSWRRDPKRESLSLELTLTLSIDESVQSELTAGLERLRSLGSLG